MEDPNNLPPEGVEVQQPEEAIFQNLYKTSPEEREEILKEQVERKKASLNYMSDLQTQMIKMYKQYRSIADPLRDDLGREIKNRANIFVPYPWAIVESAMPRLAGRLPRVHAFPRKRIEQDKVDAIQDLILYGMDRMGFLRIQQLWIRQFEIYGWSPLVYFWKSEERMCFERMKDEMGNYTMKKSPKTVWDDFGARVIDVFDSFIQPGVEQIEEGDWFMFREWMSKKDIKARVDGGIFYPEVLDFIKENPSTSGNSVPNDSKQDKESFGGLIKDFQKHTFGRYEVIYTLENDRIIVNIDGKILARVGDNPNPRQEKSVINLNLLPLVNEPIGIGTIESLGGLPDKLNALTNAELDSVSISLNKVFIANRNSNTDFDNMTSTAGNIILTDNVNDSIRELEFSDNSQASGRHIITTKEEMQFVSGVSDYIVGVKTAARMSDTATGVSSIIRESNAKFALKLAAFEAYPLRKLIEAIHTYNMMYMSEKKRIHVLGPKGYVTRDIKLDEILTECDFIIEPGSSAPLDQMSRRESLTSLLDRVIQLPQVVDINKFVKEVLEAYDIRNVEDLLIVNSKTLPEAQDIQLAEAENIALAQGQEIEFKGSDQLHIPIHERELQKTTDPDLKANIMAHLQLHIQQQQAILAQSQQAGQNSMFGQPVSHGMFGGPNGQPSSNQQPPSPPPSPAPTGAGGPPPLASPIGMGQPRGAGPS